MKRQFFEYVSHCQIFIVKETALSVTYKKKIKSYFSTILFFSFFFNSLLFLNAPTGKSETCFIGTKVIGYSCGDNYTATLLSNQTRNLHSQHKYAAYSIRVHDLLECGRGTHYTLHIRYLYFYLSQQLPCQMLFFSKNFINLLMVEGFTAAETVKSGGKDASAHS